MKSHIHDGLVTGETMELENRLPLYNQPKSIYGVRETSKDLV